MRVHPNELYLFFDPDTRDGKQAKAYALSITDHVNEFYYGSSNLTSTLWREILDRLNLEAKDLLNRADPEYQQKIAGSSMDEWDWLNILKMYPHLIKAPIVITSTSAILCKTPSDVLKIAKEARIDEVA